MTDDKLAELEQSKKRVLVVIHLDSFFTGLVGLGRKLQKSGIYEPIFFFAQFYGPIQRDIKVCQAENLAYLEPTSLPSKKNKTSTDENLSLIDRLRQRLLDYSRKSSMAGTLESGVKHSVFYQLWRLTRRLRFVGHLIRQEKISLVVLGGDIVHYDTAVFVKAAHLAHIPAVIVPGWMINQKENAEAFKYEPTLNAQQGFNRLVAKLYPRWLYEYEGRKLLRLPGGHILAREWLGLAPPIPWTLHSGEADVITVESVKMYQACISEGLPPDQLVLTGSINQDILAQVLKEAVWRREELYQKLNLLPNRPMLLAALPPNELTRIGGRPECDFQTYREVVQFWVQCLAAIEGWNVVISLHPSLKYEDMKYIEQAGVKIAQEHTAHLVPLCDLFVASVSTTIQWATVCGKPVINYDVYRYRQDDYREIKGMISMEEREEFLATLIRLTKDQALYQKMAADQATCASQWGQLDGCSGERILALFDQLIAKYEVESS